MTKKETLKFLKARRDLFNSLSDPHEILKWLRVMRDYFGRIFGKDSNMYKMIVAIQVPNIGRERYSEHLASTKMEIDWLMDDCINLVDSGIVDEKFDKNFTYRWSNAELVMIILALITVLMALLPLVGHVFTKLWTIWI